MRPAVRAGRRCGGRFAGRAHARSERAQGAEGGGEKGPWRPRCSTSPACVWNDAPPAACEFHAASEGLDVAVLDRVPVGADTTSRGKGGILLSDKEPGPELELTRLSRDLWDEADEELGPDTVELEAKGGLGCSTQGRAVMGAMNAQNAVAHPEDPAIDVCHHVFLEAPGSTAGHSRHAVAVHPGWFGVLHRLPLHRPDPGRDHGRRAARRTARRAHMPGRRTADRPTTRRDISGRMVK